MAIGQHVAKALAEKAARAAEEQEQPVPVDAPGISQADFLAGMKMLIDAIKTNDDPVAKERALAEVERLGLERDRLTREMPENKQAPLMSVYNPLGDRDNPKPELRAKTTFAGYEVRSETLTRMEIDLLNRLVGGTFMVTKADGARIPMSVTLKQNNAGTLEQVDILIPCKGDQRQNHASLVSYCQQALGEAIPSADELMAEVQRLRAELAAGVSA